MQKKLIQIKIMVMIKIFQIIQEAYKKLYEDYLTNEEDKQFTELKNSSTSFIRKKKNTRNVNFDSNNFNANKFNKIYDENKIEA